MYQEQLLCKRKDVKVGDYILFSRLKVNNIVGEVMKLREETVVVEISEVVKDELKLENNLTVVAHKNYTIISKEEAEKINETRGVTLLYELF